MSTYTPPLEDMRFVIEQVLDAPASWREQPAFAELDADIAREVLQQAARFATEVLVPINGPGDKQGCRWSPEGVKTPDGYPAAWKQFVEGGWPALACDPEVGGQGLIPLYRFYLPGKGIHFYTASESERDSVIATLGAVYRYEGIGYYVLGEDWLPTAGAARTGIGSIPVTGLGLPKLRTYAWRIPAGPVPAGGRPLVLTLHGNGGTQDIPS